MTLTPNHAFVLASGVSALHVAAAGSDIVIDTTYEAGHFFATPTLANGKKLRLLLDTGGGSRPTNWVNEIQASSVQLTPTTHCRWNNQEFQLAQPKYSGVGLPDLGGDCSGIVITDNGGARKADGQLVPQYFVRGVWTFDYPGKRVVLHKGAFKASAPATSLFLGLKEDGEKMGWPRVTITIQGGQQLDMLLDTGATSHLTKEGKNATHAETTSDGIGVASYITASMFEAWKKAHPDWVVVENGDDLLGQRLVMPIIRVPEIQLDEWKVGPVWFTRRPDSAFHDMMAELMDLKPEGAVGGNAFSSMRVTIDYPRQTVWFECLKDCRK